MDVVNEMHSVVKVLVDTEQRVPSPADCAHTEKLQKKERLMLLSRYQQVEKGTENAERCSLRALQHDGGLCMLHTWLLGVRYSA